MQTTQKSHPIIDAQVHTYERNRPERPWVGHLNGPPEVTGRDMVAAMDAVGVDGALLVSPWSMYRYDPSYALEVHTQFPGRFGLIKPFDPHSRKISEEFSEWAETSGVVGARIVLLEGKSYDRDDTGLNEVLAAGACHGLPINIICWGQLELLSALAERNPDTQIVLDHLGITQPFEPPVPRNPFADLTKVLALARYKNLAIKITGACTLSHEAFPFRDLWDPFAKIFDAYGIERCLWGTDWTRAIALLSYEEGVEAFRVTDQLTDAERDLLMGGNVARVYNWSPSNDSVSR